MAFTRAAPTSRSSSGSLYSTPRSRRSSIVVERVVMSPRVTCSVPYGLRVSLKFQNASR